MRNIKHDKAAQEAIRVIKSTHYSTFERDEAFKYMKDRLAKFYNYLKRSYGYVLRREGECLHGFLDRKLYKCILDFDKSGEFFLQYFKQAVLNAIKDLNKARHRRPCEPMDSEMLENLCVVAREVQHNVIDEVMENLGALHRKVLTLKLQGFNLKEIQKELGLTKWYIDSALTHVQKVARTVLEVN